MERIEELLRSESGVLARRDHRAIANQLDHCLRRGRLRRVLPGIYAAPDPEWDVRVRAAQAFRPGCVIGGAAAARMLWWPDCPIDTVNLAVEHQVKGSYPGFRFEQRRVPLELVVDRAGMRIASPALSVLDLIPAMGGDAIDQGLRRGAVKLPQLWRSFRLTPGRAHNEVRRRLLHDSRDEPWSEAERGTHRLLRSAGLTGWHTNFPIVVHGVTYLVDVAFPAQRVVIEIDGWEFHHTRAAFAKDRWRYAWLGAANWKVLPIPAVSVTDHPDDVLELIREALGQRR